MRDGVFLLNGLAFELRVCAIFHNFEKMARRVAGVLHLIWRTWRGLSGGIGILLDGPVYKKICICAGVVRFQLEVM